MELDIYDDMSSLFTFDVDDFTPPPQPLSSSPSPHPDRLLTIHEETPSNYTSNIQYNHQQQQLNHQLQQHNQQINHTLIQDSDGQISVKFSTTTNTITITIQFKFTKSIINTSKFKFTNTFGFTINFTE